MLLRDVNYEATADPRTAMAAAVKASGTDTVVMSFDVLAFSPEGSPVIDVTRLFTNDVAEFGIRTRLGAGGIDGGRTWVDRISTYPQNIEVEATQTWWRNDQAIIAGQMHPGDATIVVHHSMVKLPSTPMIPRLYDDRVGFFQTTPYDYSSNSQRVRAKQIIDRWRLEKKDPSVAVSEPVKAIVYYIDAATPESGATGSGRPSKNGSRHSKRRVFAMPSSRRWLPTHPKTLSTAPKTFATP